MSKITLFSIPVFWAIFLSLFATPDLSKTIYSFRADPLDVVIPSVEKDLDTLDLCIDSIKKYCPQVRRVIVVSPTNLTHKAEWIDEKSFPFSKYDIALALMKDDIQKTEDLLANKWQFGWYYQQLLKFYAAFVIPEISTNILILDSDTIYLKKVKFLDESNAGLYNTGTENHLPYFEHIDNLIPGLKKVHPEYSGVCHHMVFQRCVLEDLFQQVEAEHQMPFWKAFCFFVKNPLEFSGASEYELYFNFVMTRTSQTKIRQLKWRNTKKLDSLQKYKDQGYDYVSAHAWLRNCPAPIKKLADNGGLGGR